MGHQWTFTIASFQLVLLMGPRQEPGGWEESEARDPESTGHKPCKTSSCVLTGVLAFGDPALTGNANSQDLWKGSYCSVMYVQYLLTGNDGSPAAHPQHRE